MNFPEVVSSEMRSEPGKDASVTRHLLFFTSLQRCGLFVDLLFPVFNFTQVLSKCNLFRGT